MTNYQKVRTTQPQSVKHASEPYSQGAPAAKVADVGSGSRGTEAADDLVKNYTQFQQRMNEMKLRAQHLQDLQTMKAMGVGIGANTEQHASERQNSRE